MLYYVSHGGGCCGISHIHNFGWDDELTHRVIPEVQKLIQESSERYGDDHILEIVLTDEQVESNVQLCKELKKQGFVLVNRCINANSGAFINVLHKSATVFEGNPWDAVEVEE